MFHEEALRRRSPGYLFALFSFWGSGSRITTGFFTAFFLAAAWITGKKDLVKISLVSDYTARWGEGPLWIDGSLCYVDIDGRALVRYYAKEQGITLTKTVFSPSSVVPCRKGSFLCAGEGGIYSWDGELAPVPLVNPEADQPGHRMNDGKCSPDGFYFVGSLSPQRLPDAGLFRYDKDGQVVRVLSGVGNSNGLVWTRDGSEVFYIDTVTREVSRFDYKNGVWSNRRKAFSTAAFEGSPDGMAISEDGTLWVALCHGGRVVGFSPDGRVRAEIILPCREVTACTFGGDDFDSLYITTGVPSREPEPEAGRLFVVEGLGVRGWGACAFG